MASTRQPTDVVLRDGSTVRLRPVDPDDLVGLEAFLEGLSPESRLLRFFSRSVDVKRAAYAAVHPDADGGYATVATTIRTRTRDVDPPAPGGGRRPPRRVGARR